MIHVRIAAQAQLAGEPRREEVAGVTYRVVPCVMVRSQVLVNNIGRCYLPPEAMTEEWAKMANGAPVVADHPTVSGTEVSARDPDVLNSLGIGTVFRARVEDGALVGDVYLHEARAENVEDLAVILQRLDAGEPVEVSTGFPALGEQRTGVVNGERYDLVLYPDGFDHLAAFAEKTGACSVEDGCGLAANRLETARAAGSIQYSGTEETPWGDVDKSLTAFVAAYGTAEEEGASVADLSADTKQAIASRTILGDAGADTASDLISVPVVNPGTDNLNRGALNAAASAAGGGRGSSLPDPEGIQATVDALRKKEYPEASNAASRIWSALLRLLPVQELSLDEQRQLVRDAAEMTWGGPNTYVWVAEMYADRAIIEVEQNGQEHKYLQVPYAVDQTARTVELGDAVEVVKTVEFVPASNGRRVEAKHEYHTLEEEAEMNRTQLITTLVACAACALTEDTLNGMSDDELAYVATQAGVEVEDPDAGEGAGAAGGPDGAEPQSKQDAGADGGAGEPATQNEGTEPPAWARGLVSTMEQMGQRLDALEADTAPAREQAQQEHARLIQEVAANSDFEAEELEGKSMVELQKLHRVACSKPRSFLGLGGPRASNPGGKKELGFTVHSTLGAGPGEAVAES